MMFFSTKNHSFIIGRLFLLTLVLYCTSCAKDDAPYTGDFSKDFNPFVLTLSIESSDAGGATSSTYYNVPFADVMQGTLDAVHRGTENKGTYDFEKIGNTIYAMSDYGKTELEGIRKNKETQRTEKFGKVSLAQGMTDLIKVDDQTILGVSKGIFGTRTLKFFTIEMNTTHITGEKTIEIDSRWGPYEGKEGIDYSGMVLSGNHLFLSYYIAQPENYETNHIDTARVAVFSYPELALEKIIKDTRVGPIGGFNVKSGLIKDETGNVYAISHSNPSNGFMFQDGDHPKPAGILKIKAGETDFDPNYFFKMNEAAAGGNTANLCYLKDGKAFAEINILDRSDQGYLDDQPLRPAIIDLNTQEVHFIDGIPEYSGNGRRLAVLYEDPYIYKCIPEEDGIFVYKINSEDYSAEKGAKVEANSVVGFYRL